jgi:hypothetical protein
MDCQALPGVFIDHHHQLDRSPVVGTVEDEVPRPDVVATFGSESDTGAIVQPQSTSLGLLVRHLQTLASPDAQYPTMTDFPAIRFKQSMNPAITVAAVLACQPDDGASQG